MKISDVKLTTYQLSGNNEGTGIPVDVSPGYEYINGKRSETQTFTKYITVFDDNNFEKITVKVAGTKEVVSKEMLAQQSGKIKVKFKNLSGRFYRTANGDYALTCSADSVELLP